MSAKGSFNKKTLLAIHDMDRLAINPIEMLKRVFDEALNAYLKERGLSKNGGDAGASYLAVAGKAASDLASYKHPKLTAISLQDLNTTNPTDTLNTEQAIKVIQSDPFAPAATPIESMRVVESIKSTIETPALPIGNNNG